MQGVSKSAAFSFLLALLLAAGCGSAPHDLVSKVPDGSDLNDLDRHLARGPGSKGMVVEWTPLAPFAVPDEKSVCNEFGNFKKKSLGAYDYWKATPEERSRFTGEITFTDHGSTSSDVNSLIYVKGKLRKKDWGFLPG